MLVERTKHYPKIEGEAPVTCTSDPSLADWPTQGAIRFENVQLRYRPDLALILRGLTSEARPGERIGNLAPDRWRCLTGRKNSDNNDPVGEKVRRNTQ